MVGKESSYRIIKFIRENNLKIIIGFIFLSGIILRVLFIDTREIAYDDAFSFFLARQPIDTIISGTAADTMPPLYYILLHYWMRINQNLWFLRLLNVSLNLITGFLVYKLSDELFSRKTTIAATLLFMISPFQIYHAQELRMYSLLLFGQVGFVYSVFKTSIFKTNNSKLWFILAILFGCIAMYSHNLGFIGLISVNIIFLFQCNRYLIKRIILIQIIVFILSLPWIYYLPQQIDKVQNAFWTHPPGLLEIIQSILTLFAFLPLSSIFIFIFLFLFLQNFVILSLYLIRAKSDTLNTLALFFIFPPISLFIISYVIQPVFVPRIFIISAIWYFIFLGKYFEDFFHTIFGKLNFLMLLLISIISLVFFYQFNSFPRSEFRNLSNAIKSFESDKTAIIHDNKLSFFPTMFYYEQSNQYYLQDEPGSPNDTLAAKSQKALGYEAIPNVDDFLQTDNLIFIVFQKTINEYENQGINHPVIEKLKNNFGKEYKQESINDIIVLYFEKNEKN